MAGSSALRAAATVAKPLPMRTAAIDRRTSETVITGQVLLDGSGASQIATGVGFFDHMLDQLARHSLIDITLACEGDLHIDGHHTVEDTALALGDAIARALGDKVGIARFGHAYAPMDECLTRCALDISGRPHTVCRQTFTIAKLGALDTEMLPHFYGSFAQAAGLTLHLETLTGTNNHHIAESGFKALALALGTAVALDPRRAGQVPSTKGMLAGVGSAD